MSISLDMELTQKQSISQNMIQSMEILQMSAQELDAYLEKAALDNPCIELPDTSRYKTDALQEQVIHRKLEWMESTDYKNSLYYQQERNDGNIEESWYDHSHIGENLSDHLNMQLLSGDYSETDSRVLSFIISSLNPSGWFVDDIYDVSEILGVTPKKVEELLKIVQNLDPAGVGARNLRECLLLQLDRMDACDVNTRKIVESYLEDIAKNHLKEVSKKLNISVEQVIESCQVIKSLDPKPGNAFGSFEQTQFVSPDIVVVRINDELQVIVNEYDIPAMTINTFYNELLCTTTNEETKSYLLNKISQAKFIQECLVLRRTTLTKVAKILVKKQEEFFEYGVRFRKPLNLKDIAFELGVHESTVSRAMKGKYLQCSWGIFPLRYFLTSSAVKDSDGGSYSTSEQLKELIQKIIDEENKAKPYSDQKISEKMKEYNVDISRRTVNKYRTEMGIPDKSGRKEWS